jgi:hypothetical protein
MCFIALTTAINGKLNLLEMRQLSASQLHLLLHPTGLSVLKRFRSSLTLRQKILLCLSLIDFSG